MNPQELAEWRKEWGIPEIVLSRLEKREGIDAVLFIADDGSAEGAARRLAAHIGDAVIEVPPGGVFSLDQSAGFLTDAEYKATLFERVPERPSVLVENLETQTYSFLERLKGMLERAKRPFLLVATARTKEKVPDLLAGFFLEFRKTRKPPHARQ